MLQLLRTGPAAFTAAAILSSAGPCRAQVVTADPPLIAQVAAKVVQLSDELEQWTATAGTVSAVLNIQKDVSGALGATGLGDTDLGGYTLGQLISTAKMGFTAFQQTERTVETISSEIHSGTDPFRSLSLLSVLQAIAGNSASTPFAKNPAIDAQLQAIGNVMNGTLPEPSMAPTIQNTLYESAPQPTSDQVEAVNQTRRAVLQNATSSGMTAAAAAIQSTSTDVQASLATLSGGIANATDLRGDFKANSAVALKLLEQAAGQNALFSQLLYIDSAGAMGSQGTYAPAAPVPDVAASNTQGTVDPNNNAQVAQGSLQRFDGQAVGSGQCVALTQAADPSVGNTSTWQEGAQVNTATNLTPGTIIATFNANGSYANATDGSSHAAIYLSTNPDGSINVVDQWTGHPAQERTIYNTTSGSAANSASAFHVVTHA